MNMDEVEEKTTAWLSTLREMKRLGVITDVQYDKAQRNVKSWWYDRKTEIKQESDSDA